MKDSSLDLIDHYLTRGISFISRTAGSNPAIGRMNSAPRRQPTRSISRIHSTSGLYGEYHSSSGPN
jgi:hypothetical protein